MKLNYLENSYMEWVLWLLLLFETGAVYVLEFIM